MALFAFFYTQPSVLTSTILLKMLSFPPVYVYKKSGVHRCVGLILGSSIPLIKVSVFVPMPCCLLLSYSSVAQFYTGIFFRYSGLF